MLFDISDWDAAGDGKWGRGITTIDSSTLSKVVSDNTKAFGKKLTLLVCGILR